MAKKAFSNLEKLAEEIGALFQDDPIALNGVGTYISQQPGQNRLYINSVYEEEIIAYIGFDKVLSYDPAGGHGTTSDVLEGAGIFVFVNMLEISSRRAKELYKSSYNSIFWDLYDAAKAGKISSKIWSEMRLHPATLKARRRRQAQSAEMSKQARDEFLNAQDPATRRALEKVAARIKRKKISARIKRKKP
jgi:hypothetical protein